MTDEDAKPTRATRTPKAAADPAPEGPLIYKLISKISAEAGALAPVASGGVPFPFRGIDGTINHLSPHLQANGVITIPEVLDRVTTPRESGSRVITQTDVLTKFTFIAPDGSSVSAVTAGLAQDFADRSAAQAQSVAYRIALLQVFTLPTQSPEPEQTGQVVQDGREAAPTRAQTQVAKAVIKTDSKGALRTEIQQLMGKLKINGQQVNEIGAKYHADFFNDEEALIKVRDELKERPAP
jgi:hypothetical protein